MFMDGPTEGWTDVRTPGSEPFGEGIKTNEIMLNWMT